MVVGAGGKLILSAGDSGGTVNPAAALSINAPVTFSANNAANALTFVNSGTGGINIGANVSTGTTGANTIRLNASNGAITQSAGVITATNLGLRAAGDITLSGANIVTTVAGNISGGVGNDFTYNDSNGITLGSVAADGALFAATNGITTQGGNISVTAGGGYNISQSVASNGGNISLTVGAVAGGMALVAGQSINAGSGSVTLQGGTGGGAANAINLVGAASNVSGTGGVSFTANNIAINAAANVNAGAATVTLRPRTATTQTLLGGADSATAMGLLDTELDRITAGAVVVGGVGYTGNINVSGAVSATTYPSLTLQTTGAGTITDTAGSITVPTLNLLATSGITLDAAPLVVSGTTTITAGAGNATLSTATNNFGTVVVASGNNVVLRDANALVLGASTVGGTLGVTTAGALTQSGALTVTGTTTLAAGAGNDITLNLANNFGTVAVTNGNNVTLNDTNALVLGASTISGNLAVTTNGAITDSGNVTVNGTTSLNAGAGNDIVLNNANNFVGTVSVTNGNNVTLVDANAIQLGAINTANNLTVTGVGITQNASGLTVGGTSAFNGGAGAITLNTASNDFTGAVSLNNSGANAVAITDANAITLGTSSAGTGTLTVNAAGVTQAGAITQAAGAGAATFNAGANAITLGAANNFTGAVSLNNSGANNVAVTDVNAIILGTSSVGTGTLSVNGIGITQTGAITQAATAGAATFNAGAGVITLTNAANNFTGAVALNNTGANNVAVTDVNGIVLGASNVGTGTLTVNAVGITQTGTITQAVTAGAATFNAGAGVITLTNAANNFTGAVSLNNSGANSVAVTDANALTLGTSAIGGNLAIIANGAITDSGNVTVTGTTTLAAGAANDITLNNANNFVGAVSVTSGNNVTLVDANAIQLGAITTTNNLTVTGVGITQNASGLSVGGTSVFNGGAGAITLNTASNDFIGAVSLNNSGANNVSVLDNNALTLGASTLGTGTNHTIQAGGSLTIGSPVVVGAGGKLILSAGDSGGTVNPAAALSINAPVTFSANNAANALTFVNSGTGGINIGANVSTGTTGANTIRLNASNGAITQSAGVITATNLGLRAAGDITLSGANIVTTVAGNISGGVGNDFTYNDSNGITLGSVAADGALFAATNGITTQGGNISVTAGGGYNISQSVASNGGNISLTVGAVAGGMALVAGQSINAGSGSVTLQGGTGGGAANAINLVGAASNVSGTGGVSFTANNIAINAAANVNAGAATVTLRPRTATTQTLLGGADSATAMGLLDTELDRITAGAVVVGGVGYTGNINVSGAVSATTYPSLTLQTTGAGTITDTAGSITVPTLNLLATSGITLDAAPLVVSGTTTITAGAGNATLSTATNNFGTVVVASGNNVVLRDANALVLGASTVGGTLGVTTAGALTQSGALTVTGTTTLAAGAGNDITLNLANNFGTVAVTNGNNVTINDVNAISLGASTVSGALGVTTAGAITQSGALAVAGVTTLAAGVGNDITLANPANNFGTVQITSAGNVSLVDANALTVGTAVASSFTTLSARTLTGNLTLGGNLIATGGGDSIVLAAAARFLNSGGNTLNPGSGRFLVWSANPNPFGGGTPDNRGGLAYNFKQYNAAFGAPVLGAGNGFLYTFAPSITPGLTGAVARVYDGSTAATLAAGNFTATGAVDGDTITLSGTGTYDNRNAGTLKTVTASGIAASATNGAATVYGYTVLPTTANAAIGEITAAPLTVTAQTDSRGYNGTTNSAGAPVVTGTLYDAVGTAAAQSYDTRHVGNNKTLTASGLVVNDGNGGNNYAVTYVNDNTGVITAAPLTVTAQTDNRVYDGTTSSAVAPVVGALFAGDTVGTAPTQMYDNQNAGINKTLNASGLAINDGNGGNNYAIVYVPNATGVITARGITVTANNAAKIYGDADPAFAFNVGGAGLAGGDTIASVFAGALARAPGENVAGNPYAINQGTLASNANYSITTYTPGLFTITPRALTITADNASKSTGALLPPFTATYTGFAFADNPASLAGVLVFATPATAGSPAGAYVITPSGQTSTNYTISYVIGTLTVNASASAGAGGIPADVLASINSGGDQLPPPHVSGPPTVATTFAGVQPTQVSEGGTAAGNNQQVVSGVVNNLVDIINGGVNLPAGLAP